MKKKVTTILLVVAVLTIWTTVAVKVFSALSFINDPVVPVAPTAVKITGAKQAAPELLLNYSDPFFPTRPANASSSNQAQNQTSGSKSTGKKSNTKKGSKNNKAVKLSYHGLVTSSSQKRIVLSINGKRQVVDPSQDFEGFTVVSVLKDSIQVVLLDGKTWIKR